MISAYIWQINLFWRPRRKLYASVEKYLSKCTVPQCLKSKSSDCLACSHSEEKTAKKKKIEY